MIFAKSFYDMNQKIQTKKSLFPKFMLIPLQFRIFKSCMIICVSLIPKTTGLNKVSCMRISVKISLISY